MAIVPMKRLRILAMESDRDRLLGRLQRLGCVEVSEPEDRLQDPEWAALVHRDESDLAREQEKLALAEEALAILDRYAPSKSGFLKPLPLVEEGKLLDEAASEQALEAAGEIRERSRELSVVRDRISRREAAMGELEPWLPLEIPLETGSTANVLARFGTIPASAELLKVRERLLEAADSFELYEAGSDPENHYLFFLCHKSQAEGAMEVLQSFGFTQTVFKDLTGTARENYDAQAAELKALRQQEEELTALLSAQGDKREALRLCYDHLTQTISRETCKQRLLSMDQTFLLEGWVAEPEVPGLEELLRQFDLAYDLSDPTEEEIPQVPIKLKNGPLSRCMNVVTEMYSLPAYDGLDPNPLMAPFFIIFFGMMMADMGYGILMIAAAILVLKKTRPREGTRNFMELVLLCGIATFLWGALTGGFLGDFIPQIAKIINPDTTLKSLPHLFTPLDNTVAILLGSLVLGLIQVVTGMAISVWKKTKDGHFADAFWDEITWWVILIGVGLMALGIGNLAGVPVVLVIGGVMLLYGSTRNAKGFGKVAAFIAAVYNGVSGFFSDILSYLRLMALMLSGSVIASVFNTLGATFGNVPLFIIISLIGNAINLALNLLGCYVHDLRLQCLEYFGRFYKEGGKPFGPLSIQTKYNDIIKEEN